MTHPPKEALPVVEYIRENVPRPKPFLNWPLYWPIIVSEIPMSEATDKGERAFLNWAKQIGPQAAINAIWGER